MKDNLRNAGEFGSPKEHIYDISVIVIPVLATLLFWFCCFMCWFRKWHEKDEIMDHSQGNLHPSNTYTENTESAAMIYPAEGHQSAIHPSAIGSAASASRTLGTNSSWIPTHPPSYGSINIEPQPSYIRQT